VPVVPPTPIQGLLTEDDSEENPALKLLLARFEQMESTLRLELAEQRAAVASTNEELGQVRKELAAEQARSREAQAIAIKQAEKLYEARPTDPKVREAIQSRALEDGKRHIATKRMQIKNLIETATTGEVLNLTDQVITLGIHGFLIYIYPGRNVNIPQPFVDEWEKRQVREQQAKRQNRVLHKTDHNFGDLEALRTEFVGSTVPTTIYDPVGGRFGREDDDNTPSTS
jgi:hypothetical protein